MPDDVIDCGQGLAAFGFGPDTVVSSLGSRCRQLTRGGSSYVLKIGTVGPNSESLLNEACCLRAHTDRVIDLYEGPFGVFLLLRFIKGTPLSLERPGSAADLLSELYEMHRLGLVFCDLTPANVLVDSGRIYLIDWEFCCAIGTELSAMKRRPYSSGFTHPDIIWGRGVARTDLDLFAVDRMCELRFLR